MWTFQQDNDPKHTSKSTQKWFSWKQNQCFAMAISVPDLNPIENMWSEFKRAVHKRKPKDMNNLERFWMEEWSKILPALLHITEIGSVLLFLPGETAPSTKSNNCEFIYLFFNFGWFHWIINKVKYFPYIGKCKYIWVMVLFGFYSLFFYFSTYTI